MSMPLTLASAADLIDLSIREMWGYGPNSGAFKDGDAEYIAFNERCQARYDTENAAYRFKMQMIMWTLITCMGLFIYVTI